MPRVERLRPAARARRVLPALLALAAVTLGAASASVATSQEEPQDATPGELRTLVERLHALRAESRELEETQAADRDALGADVARLQDDLDLARARLEARTAQAADRATRTERARALAQRIDDGLAALAGDAQELARARAQAVAAGIPFQRADRESRLAPDGLAGDADARARALVTLLGALGEELRLAGTLEERATVVALPDDRELHAYVVRLGLLREAFVSEDGLEVGLSEPGGGWRTDLAPETRAAVEALVAMARGRRAAELVPIPLGTGAR